MGDDVILNKCSIIERCIQRIHEEYNDNPISLESYTKQDSIILNIQRGCEAAIDLAMHIVAENKWGIPQSSREVFDILLRENYIDESLTRSLKSMVGFRNIAVHNYQALNLLIVRQVIEKHLNDLRKFSRIMLQSSI
ncbi:type VII toxin-antitoxin system HepT family RNase toxin [Desulfosporosinus hippei]|uniref:Uncharacterized conserved protein YutE, UPF0331/DUF86 family n=1 Tax=Desulfosporosinus hippei DSM 8344 TaxID=1121419 RepID=A0A1G8H6B8_9FIRM|nr:DUF86 domain-containing protein [Desulfosporosinus hippei]SDI02080.1 Uncharacterized conserved protein YutE, UPF0331/DUF86 family [Desulfosporosinus hippei DSM 8344]